MFPNLKVENLSCVRSETTLFENLNFEVLPGQNLEIIGSNGSGKLPYSESSWVLQNKSQAN